MFHGPIQRSRRLFAPILAGAKARDRLLACLGVVAGIAVIGLVCGFGAQWTLTSHLVAPIGASALLLFVVPASPLAQPWPIIGGNVLSALVGLVVAHLGLPIFLSAGVATAAAILLMSALRCLHPPGGAVALSVVIGGSASLATAVAPVLLNSLVLVLAGLVYHRFSGHAYPHRPVAVLPYEVDLDLALEDLGETFDVAREDLEMLFARMEFHRARRR